MDAPVFRLRRLRTADSIPLAIHDCWYPLKYCGSFLTETYHADSVYKLLEENGFELVHATQTVSAKNASRKEAELLGIIAELNADAEVDGILVQLPLPESLEEAAVIAAIAPEKDVDCFHPYNVGRLNIGDPVFQPCTPAGVMEMLREYGISPAGKRCVVLGRSNIVGKPMAALLTQADGTVTLCHSKTPDLADITRQADILVSAVGKVNCVTADMVKDGAVVIDVAMNRNEAGKLCGDVDLAAVEPKASYITPVPGGVGPMTRAMLMRNILTAAEAHLK